MIKFLNKADLKNATLQVGQKVYTRGLVTDGDGGGAQYIIVPPTVADDAAKLELFNGNIAEIQITGTARAKQFGVKDNVDATVALTVASEYVHTLSFEGLTNVIATTVPTVGTHWLLHGCTVLALAGGIDFTTPSMLLDLGGGRLQGGNKLGRVAITSGINTNVLELEDASMFNVGDHIACSLDNGYLPNSPSRSGVAEHGDLNRILSKSGNTLTMTYNFLRDDLYTVDSGIVAGAWVGNNLFGAEGLHFTGKGAPIIRNGTIGLFPSYTIKVEDGTPDGQLVDPRTTRMLVQDVLFEDATIDLIWFRGLGITFDHVTMTQQKDFGKQFAIVSTPYDTGYIKYINGCNIARMNRDGEILPFHFNDQAYTECGLLSLDGTNVFDGAHDPDIVAAPDGEIQFYGARVVNSDSILAFHLFDTHPAKWKGIHSKGDTFKNYMWGIFATTSATPVSFEWDTIIFEGSFCGCDPVFIKSPSTSNEQLVKDYAQFIGGEYHARVNFQINQGVHTVSTGATWICPRETTLIPASPTVELKNVDFRGGYMSGGWQSTSNNNRFENVTLAYANNTAINQEKSLLITSPLGAPVDVVSFLLEPPEEYEDTGASIREYDGIVDLSQWIGFNQSNLGIGSNVKFRMRGYQAEFYTASELGYSKLYTATFSRPSENAGLFVQAGAWTRPRVGDLLKNTSGQNSTIPDRIDTVLATTAAGNVAIGVAEITLNTVPVGNEEFIGVLEPNEHNWYWYKIDSITGSTVTIGNSSSASVGVVKAITASDKIQLFTTTTSSGGGGTEQIGTKVDISANLSTPLNALYVVPFNNVQYNELGAYDGGATTRLTVPANVSRVDMSGYVQYASNSLPVDTAFYLRITHFASNGSTLEVVAATTQRTGFLSHRCSISELGIPVVQGDYFELEVFESSFAADIGRARFTMIKVK